MLVMAIPNLLHCTATTEQINQVVKTWLNEVLFRKVKAITVQVVSVDGCLFLDLQVPTQSLGCPVS